jgi:hypothetical protein
MPMCNGFSDRGAGSMNSFGSHDKRPIDLIAMNNMQYVKRSKNHPSQEAE